MWYYLLDLSLILKEMFTYINSGIKLDSNKYNQKLSLIYVLTKWMTNNYFLS